MVAGCGNKCMKCLLVIICLVLLALSGALVALCIWGLVDPEASVTSIGLVFGSKLYFIAVIVLLIVGSLVFLFSLIGLGGACCENRCMLNMFCWFMALLAIAILAGAILAFVYRSNIEDKVLDGLTESLTKEYGDNSDVTEAWDDVQEHMKCCGIKGDALKADNSWYAWRRATNFFNVNQANYLVPASCCVKNGDDISNLNACTGISVTVANSPPRSEPASVTTANQFMYMNGCYSEVVSQTEEHALIIGIVAIIVFLVLIFAVVFGCCLVRSIRAEPVYRQ